MIYQLIILIIKELQSLLRDPQTRALLIMPVIVQVILFPLTATLEVKHATVAIFDKDNSVISRELIEKIKHAESFDHVLYVDNQVALRNILEEQKALIAITIPAEFSKHLSQNQSTSLQIILDGRHSNSAQIAANYVQQIVQNYAQEISSQLSSPNQLVIRNWYNPTLDYKWFVVPSLVAMITTIGTLIVTALSVAREREQGTLDQLLVSPLHTWQLFVGKTVPALLVGIFQATIVLLIGVFVYQIPFAGSLILFYGCMLSYSISLTGFGLLISSICMTQQQAFIGVFVFVMPTILLSGYVSPVENMPDWLQKVTLINPIRHFIEITKQIYLKDADLLTVLPSIQSLFTISIITLTFAYLLFKRKVS